MCFKMIALARKNNTGGGPTPITPETDQILPVGHGQEWSRMVKNVFSLKEVS